MKVYITKYAFTRGILTVEAKSCSDSPTTVSVILDSEEGYPSYFHKGEWHSTRAEAVRKTKELRVNKIRALQKQITKLANMTF